MQALSIFPRLQQHIQMPHGAKMPILPPALRVKRIRSSATIPTRGSSRSIGADLYADLRGDELVYVPARDRLMIHTSIAIQFPIGFYARVAPRSGLAYKQGIDVLAGVIDQDYTGEVCVILMNLTDDAFAVRHGDRIAQLILERAEILPIIEVLDLDETKRGDGGFGSTGV